MSRELLLLEDECSPPLFWLLPRDCEPVVPDSFWLPGASLALEPAGIAAKSKELRQLPKRAAFHEPLDEVVLSLAELELSSLTTFKGFSNALRMYLMGGRREGLGFRQDLATMAIAHTSSNKSSSTMRDGSTIFVTSSLSYMVMYGNV